MKPSKSIGIYIFIALLLVFIPAYLHYQYSHFIKASKAHLIYEHNKNYNRKMSFPDTNVYKIFNSSVKGDIEQITFTDATFSNKNKSLKISLLGDKPYFSIMEKGLFHQTITNYFFGKNEQRNFFLNALQKNKSSLSTTDGLMYQTIFIPYLPSYLGHIKIQKVNNEYLLAYGETMITADIQTNELGLISSITTQKYSASFSEYFEKKGVKIPKSLTINGSVYQLKKIKMNLINTRH